MKKIMMGAIIFIIIMLASIISGDKENKAEPNIIDIDVVNDKEGDKNEDKSLELMKLAEEEYAHNDIDDKKQNIKEEKIHTANRGSYREVPKTNTSMKSYMDYKAITNKSSEQYKLQQRGDIYTDNEGFRRIGDKFVVAVGTYFGTNVGQEVEIKLSSGNTFKAIIGDIKADIHTDSQNIQHNVDGSVVEFLVNQSKLEKTIKAMGDCSYSKVNDFKGDVVGIMVLDK
jgi:hypothetical protein